jgi:hypothetical protein
LLLDRKVRDMVVYVAQGAESLQLKKLASELTDALENARLSRARDNLVLTLAELGVSSQKVLSLLEDMLESKRPLRAAPAAIGLAKLGDKRGFEYLLRQLEAEPAAASYPAASLLAELGAPGIEQLATKVRQQSRAPQLTADIEHVLRGRAPRNCLEERYANYLIACLHGSCQLPAATDPASGCPSFYGSRH